MAYFNTNLIARRGYAGVPARAAAVTGKPYRQLAHEIQHATSGLGGLLDDLESGVKSVVSFYGNEQQQVGASNVLQAQNAALTNALAQQQQSAISPGTMLLVGGGALALFLIMRKKKQG
jgi:hypothetical protein